MPMAPMTEALRSGPADKGWDTKEWCYKESAEGWLSLAEIETKRGEVTTQCGTLSIDLQEPSPESRAIDTESIRKHSTGNWGVFDGRSG